MYQHAAYLLLIRSEFLQTDGRHLPRRIPTYGGAVVNGGLVITGLAPAPNGGPIHSSRVPASHKQRVHVWVPGLLACFVNFENVFFAILTVVRDQWQSGGLAFGGRVDGGCRGEGVLGHRWGLRGLAERGGRGASEREGANRCSSIASRPACYVSQQGYHIKDKR